MVEPGSNRYGIQKAECWWLKLEGKRRRWLSGRKVLLLDGQQEELLFGSVQGCHCKGLEAGVEMLGQRD